MSHLRLFLFGAPYLEREGAPFEFDTRKALALLAYLALGGQSYSRDTLIGLFWPDYDQSRARNSLRRTLSVLTRVIGKEGLEADRETVALVGREGFWVDVLQFRQLVTACRSHGHPLKEFCAGCLPLLTEALALYRGDFMAGFNLRDSAEEFEAWRLFQSESLRRELAALLEKLANNSAAQDDFESAIDYARRWVALDPLDEPAQRRLMQLYTWAGQRSAALRQYQSLVRLFDEELGAPPSAETEMLYRAIEEDRLASPPVIEQGNRGAREQGGVPISTPLLPRPPAPLHNLPAQATPLIGREAELAHLNHLLGEPGCRLLTLTGPGGVGKTRLALEAAWLQRERFADGVYFVSLARLSRAEFIAPAVAKALSFDLQGPDEPKRQLLHYLREKNLLLVLDNLEHLLALPEASTTILKAGASVQETTEIAPSLLAELLQQAPALKLLITSRERLRLHGEWVFELQGLSIPSAQAAAEFDSYSAVRLFVESARRIDPGFVLTPATQPDVARICQLVQGLPLGLELAAAWVRLLSCAEIAQEIERNLDFLSHTAPDLPPRQRSLRAAFDHSWKLLSAEEQQALSRLSVFRGGFSRKAAEQVAGATLPLLAALVDKSLLRRIETRRYDLHELVRQFAAGYLSQKRAEEEEMCRRHSRYYLALLSQREAALQSIRQKETLAELNEEIDNIRLAWEWAVAHQQTGPLRQASAAVRYFYELSNLQEGETIFKRAVEMAQSLAAAEPDQAGPDTAMGVLLAHQAYFAGRLGRNEQSRSLLQQSLELLRRGDDRAGLADALSFYGMVCWFAGDFDEAARAFQESVALNQALERAWYVAINTHTVGIIAHERGDYDEALSWLNKGLGLCRATGDPRLMAMAINFLSRTRQALGHYAEVRQLLNESLKLATESGSRYSMGWSLERLALLAEAGGEAQEAQRLFQESLKLFKAVGDPWSLARLLNHLGRFNQAQGNSAEAQRYFLQALRTAATSEIITPMLEALAGLATLFAAGGAHEAALEIARHILRHPATSPEIKAQAEQLCSKLDARLTPQQVEISPARTFKTIVEDILKQPGLESNL